MGTEKIVPGATSLAVLDERWPKEGLRASLRQIEESDESLVKMPSSQRTAEVEIMETQTEIADPRVQWVGWDLATMPTADALLVANTQVFTPEELRAARVFALGQQWPEEVKAARGERVTLVVNMVLPLIAKALKFHGTPMGMVPSTQDVRDAEMVTAIIVAANRDAQLLYNYQVSRAAELSIDEGPQAFQPGRSA